MKTAQILLEELANIFTQTSHELHMRASKQTDKQAKRDNTIAANVWGRAAAFLRKLKEDLPKELAVEKMHEVIRKYHNGED